MSAPFTFSGGDAAPGREGAGGRRPAAVMTSNDAPPSPPPASSGTGAPDGSVSAGCVCSAAAQRSCMPGAAEAMVSEEAPRPPPSEPASTAGIGPKILTCGVEANAIQN